jgi:hypothetical protein
MVFFHLIEAYGIESVDEVGIGLAIDLGERDSLEIEIVHGVGIKEELAAVLGGKELAFFLLGDDGCNLWTAPRRSIGPHHKMCGGAFRHRDR